MPFKSIRENCFVPEGIHDDLFRSHLKSVAFLRTSGEYSLKLNSFDAIDFDWVGYTEDEKRQVRQTILTSKRKIADILDEDKNAQNEKLQLEERDKILKTMKEGWQIQKNRMLNLLNPGRNKRKATPKEQINSPKVSKKRKTVTPKEKRSTKMSSTSYLDYENNCKTFMKLYRLYREKNKWLINTKKRYSILWENAIKFKNSEKLKKYCSSKAKEDMAEAKIQSADLKIIIERLKDIKAAIACYVFKCGENTEKVDFSEVNQINAMFN